jgi:dienelactone hydrolase
MKEESKSLFQHLGIYSDWVAAAYQQQALFPVADPGEKTRDQLREVLGFTSGPEAPLAVQQEGSWERDGVHGELISWSVGYGPRTQAYVLRPSGSEEPLPGVITLHDHSGFKYSGKEKIADGPEGPASYLISLRQSLYSGRAYANELAKEGFIVLAHDTFLWGSRRFPLEDIPAPVRETAKAIQNANPLPQDLPEEVYFYNLASGQHEHVVEKYCNVLGTSMAGVVAYEDRVALNYLLSRPDVDQSKIACLGLSGGGNRSALLLATHSFIRAAVIVGLMSTYAGMLDHNIQTHTWMLFPHGWSRYGDWSDIAASRAPMPLLVQYDLEDNLFTPEGMHAAHQRIINHYQNTQPQAYEGQFYPGPHKFDLEMQSNAFHWLKTQLS